MPTQATAFRKHSPLLALLLFIAVLGLLGLAVSHRLQIRVLSAELSKAETMCPSFRDERIIQRFQLWAQPEAVIAQEGNDATPDISAEAVLALFIEALRESNTAALAYLSPLASENDRKLLVSLDKTERESLIESLEQVTPLRATENRSEFSIRLSGNLGIVYVYTDKENRGVVF